MTIQDQHHFPGRIYVQGIRELKAVRIEPQVPIVKPKPLPACNLEEFIEMTERKPKLLRLLIKRVYMNMVFDGMRLVVIPNRNKKTIENIKKFKYNYIEIQTGYHDFAPRLTAPVIEVFESDQRDKIERNGETIFLNPGDFVIKIGDIIKIENI